MNRCICAEYGHLQLDTSSIYERLAQTRSILPNFQLVAAREDGEHKLFRCPVCSQAWQLSKAWIWNNVEYVFKVLKGSPVAWQKNFYLPPDEMTYYNKTLREFIDKQSFSEINIECNVADCSRQAISLSIKCLRHHVEQMQLKNALLKIPQGKILLPYGYSNESFAFYLG